MRIMMRNELRFIDICSGIGGGRLGLEANGLKCVGYSEIDLDAEYTYRMLYGDELAFGDLTKIEPKTLPEFDLLIGGFPCQTFSIVGKRCGLGDEDRGQIIYHIARILKESKSNYFILENVKGLVNHDKGRTFEIVLNLLKDLDYEVHYSVLNSLDYGVPQMRERIYLVGIKKELVKEGQTFSFPQKMDRNYNIADFLSDNREEFIFDNSNRTYETFEKYLSNKYNNGKYNLEELLKEDYIVLDTRQSDLRIYEKKVPTLRRGRQGILYIKNGQLRRLSGYEAFLLQGFDKNRALKASKEQTNGKLLAQAGNAMTINVIDAITKELLKVI
jgi:DNA (cytosine-5)-methyltransferase 1